MSPLGTISKLIKKCSVLSNFYLLSDIYGKTIKKLICAVVFHKCHKVAYMLCIKKHLTNDHLNNKIYILNKVLNKVLITTKRSMKLSLRK